MKRCPIVLAAICVLATPAAFGADAPDTVLDRLADSAAGLRAEVADVSPEQVLFRPGPERWSILECVEHIVLAEAAITDILRHLGDEQPAGAATAAEAPRISDDEILGLTTDRSRRFNAPSEIRPSGRFASLEEALAAFARGREELLAALRTEGRDLRDSGAVNRALGRYLDGVQWSLLASGHVVRHTLQIREVKESEGYPR